MPEQDVNNFSSSPHRLPTISASQALQGSTYAPPKHLSTGLPTLDQLLADKTTSYTIPDGFTGGLPCGQVTEVYGPPGVGKTAFALNVASKVLLAGESVSWIDAAYALSSRRLRDALAGGASNDACLERFDHLTTPTLPHLLALLVHSSTMFPPKDTRLLVIDSISTLLNNALVQSKGHNDRMLSKKSDVAQWAAGRRWAVMGDLASAMAKLAATRNIAIMVTTQTTTRLKAESAALLQPAMCGNGWDAGINYRVLLFRDWQEGIDSSSREQGATTSEFRFAALTRIGSGSVDGFGEIVPFAINEYGLIQPIFASPASPALTMHEPLTPLLPALKRKREEIADSASESGDVVSDDEFGWAED